MPIDYDDAGWRSSRWGLDKDDRILSRAEGPVGLRLPLDRLPPSVPRRAMSIERSGQTIAIFIPPLLQEPFVELLAAIEASASAIGLVKSCSRVTRPWMKRESGSRWGWLRIPACSKSTFPLAPVGTNMRNGSKR